MPSVQICSEEEVAQLVHSFYGTIRADEVLGPIFDLHVKSWDDHLLKMIDFWSSALRKTARYRGMPMPAHTGLPGLSVDLFQRWLTLFRKTTAGLANEALRERANELALRIAESLWYGYQLKNESHRLPKEFQKSREHGE